MHRRLELQTIRVMTFNDRDQRHRRRRILLYLGLASSQPRRNSRRFRSPRTLRQATKARPQQYKVRSTSFGISDHRLAHSNVGTCLTLQDAVSTGLLYLKNPKSDRRPLPTDSITLTVTVATEASLKDPSSTLVQDNTLVAGAKLPMNRIRFPMRFQLSERNLLNGDATEWKKALETQDLMVQARVCSQETIGSGVSGLELLRTCQNNPTSDGLANDRSRIQAMGISKLLRFSDEQAIRAPVSLPLEYR